jgi:hypothetical protein
MTWLEVFARRRPTVRTLSRGSDLTRAYQLSYKKGLVDNPAASRSRSHGLVASSGRSCTMPAEQASNDAKVANLARRCDGDRAAHCMCQRGEPVARAGAAAPPRDRPSRRVGHQSLALLMQLVTESLVLAFFGAIAGLVLARWGGGAMRALLLGDTLGADSGIVDARSSSLSQSLATDRRPAERHRAGIRRGAWRRRVGAEGRIA